MKILISLLFMFSVTASFACSPSPYRYVHQIVELRYITNAPELFEALHSVPRTDKIKSISDEDGHFLVTTSSNCTFKVDVLWTTPQGGMCPIPKGIKISEQSCL